MLKGSTSLLDRGMEKQMRFGHQIPHLMDDGSSKGMEAHETRACPSIRCGQDSLDFFVRMSMTGTIWNDTERWLCGETVAALRGEAKLRLWK